MSLAKTLIFVAFFSLGSAILLGREFRSRESQSITRARALVATGGATVIAVFVAYIVTLLLRFLLAFTSISPVALDSRFVALLAVGIWLVALPKLLTVVARSSASEAASISASLFKRWLALSVAVALLLWLFSGVLMSLVGIRGAMLGAAQPSIQTDAASPRRLI